MHIAMLMWITQSHSAQSRSYANCEKNKVLISKSDILKTNQHVSFQTTCYTTHEREWRCEDS